MVSNEKIEIGFNLRGLVVAQKNGSRRRVKVSFLMSSGLPGCKGLDMTPGVFRGVWDKGCKPSNRQYNMISQNSHVNLCCDGGVSIKRKKQSTNLLVHSHLDTARLATNSAKASETISQLPPLTINPLGNA